MQTDWIFLYGPPGVGKSSLGRMLARRLDLPFSDLDEQVEQSCGSSIAELFANQGEAAFRRGEREMLARVLSEAPGVVALGGGSLLDEGNRVMVQERGPVVCLRAPLRELAERLRQSASPRPLLEGDLERKLAELLGRRADHYASFPRQVACDGLPPEESVLQIQLELGRFHVAGMGQGYGACLVNGGLDEVGAAIQRRGLGAPAVVVSDENVALIYWRRVLHSLQAAGLEATLINLPAGEQFKTIASLQALWEGFLRTGLERNGTVIALGGGVVSDVAGFAAATFMRGVSWVILPTTLLAMVDASLGGKTGVDLPQGKNLAGAYHSPCMVLADPGTLDTLPIKELRCGMAEVVKAGLTGDRQLFETCTKSLGALPARRVEIIGRAMAVKIRLVELDPYEQGARAALNLGHTLGHALETLSGYQLAHGEAVAIGLVGEARLAESIGLAQVGLAEQIESCLVSLGLPVALPAWATLPALVSAMQADKKRRNGELQFSLPAGVGDVRTGIRLEPNEIISILNAHTRKKQ